MTSRPGSAVSDAAGRERRIVEVIRALQPGEVVSYGDIADVAGFPRLSRLVGRILSTSSETNDLPWWRVVTASGRLVPGHEVEQASLLRDEDVVVRAGRVIEAPHGRFRERAR